MIYSVMQSASSMACHGNAIYKCDLLLGYTEVMVSLLCLCSAARKMSEVGPWVHP